MVRRTVLILLLAFAISVASGSLCLAQSTVPRDAGVFGSGSIPVHQNIGRFSVNVWRTGNMLFGGFDFTEIDPTSAVNKPVHVITSTVITGLTVQGNTAKATAIGFWNNMPADIVIEALDDLAGDWFHITARPRGPVTIAIIYDAAGGVKGDLYVYTRAPDGTAKGMGTIAVGKNVGKFNFAAQKLQGVVRGRLDYMEFSPTGAAPRIQISLPAVQSLVIIGKLANIAGIGTLNGRPAKIEVQAVDNNRPDALADVRDEFFIKATPLVNSTTPYMTPVYRAGGPLTSGDIVVLRVSTTP